MLYGYKTALYIHIYGVFQVTTDPNVLLKTIHLKIQAREGARITQSEMAKRVGISQRTYVEYLRGTNSPMAMKALLSLLTQLDDEEIVKIVREWKNPDISKKRH